MKYLRQAIIEADWHKVIDTFNSMSNMEFRRAESFVRTSVLPTLDNDTLWMTLYQLISYRRQAFLSGILSIRHLVSDGSLQFDCEGARLLASHLQTTHPDSVMKVLNMCLPLLSDEKQIQSLLSTFDPGSDHNRIAALLKVSTPQSYYSLFLTLRRTHEGKPIALRCAQYIIRQGDDRAYNMASILKAYFGLDELQGQFSLHIEPYELSQLESGSEAFYHLLDGRRPKVNLI